MPKYKFPLFSESEAKITGIVLVVTFILLMVLAFIVG